ncbi:oxidoreductase HTATIP2-like isoform X2 [Tigriopus californicus]|uniref:oxidoreductase HTATIP2-like isoform X2 n=1 Tax=Tigriopus californicus TaxID=6832 RepID=UPI0027DAAA7E|nr:oxidoreductase HTATIP2-like isoform X2 [Tigriopus californicus]XP_059087311.1 oxidoreductase HTATIP2-like isoform X2 [Tigriopus californicus]
MSKTAIIFGASGATGQELLSALTSSYSIKKIIVVVRKAREKFEHLKNVEQWVVDFDKLLKTEELYNFCGIDIGFCCIGTTLQKSSRAEFIQVERNLVYRIGQVLKRDGCEEFHLVTGFMSNSSSRFFIPRVKGESEDLVAALQFQRLVIYRPGLLRCSRSEYRPWEHLAQWISSLVDFWNLWSISTDQLAEAMVEVVDMPANCLKTDRKDCHILEHKDIVQIWQRADGT